MLVLPVLWLAGANLCLLGMFSLRERRQKKQASGRGKWPRCG